MSSNESHTLVVLQIVEPLIECLGNDEPHWLVPRSSSPHIRPSGDDAMVTATVAFHSDGLFLAARVRRGHLIDSLLSIGRYSTVQTCVVRLGARQAGLETNRVITNPIRSCLHLVPRHHKHVPSVTSYSDSVSCCPAQYSAHPFLAQALLTNE